MPVAPAIVKGRKLKSDGGKPEDHRPAFDSMLRSTFVPGRAVSAITNRIRLRSLANTPAQSGADSSETDAALVAEGVYDANPKPQSSESSMQPRNFITPAKSLPASLLTLVEPQSEKVIQRQQELPQEFAQSQSSPLSNSPGAQHIREAPHSLLQARQSLPSESLVPPEKSTQNNGPSMNVIITIVLAIIAGVAVISLVVLLIYTRFRRRRTRRRSGDRRPQSHSQVDNKGQHTSDNLPAPLILPNIVSLPPLSPSLPPFAFTPTSPEHDKMTASSRDENPSAPPRLENRRYHQATKSDSSIQPSPTTMRHTRWGKPLSMSILSSSGPGRQALDDRLSASSWENRFHDPRPPPSIGPSRTHTRQPVPAALQLSHQATVSMSTASSMASQMGYNEKSLASTTSHRTHKTAASASTMSSMTSRTGYQDHAPLSPPQTPRQGAIPASPGPPPSRSLPSPPLKSWQVNPLSQPVEAEMEDVPPEEIGIAVSSSIPGIPTPLNTPVRHSDFKMSLGTQRNFSAKDSRPREKRPRLSEADMERLGGTYSSFKR